MIVERCEACDRKISVSKALDFNYTEVADGPYCDTCWFFMRHIEALRDRVTDLELKVREPVSKRSPYDPRSMRPNKRKIIEVIHDS